METTASRGNRQAPETPRRRWAKVGKFAIPAALVAMLAAGVAVGQGTSDVAAQGAADAGTRVNAVRDGAERTSRSVSDARRPLAAEPASFEDKITSGTAGKTSQGVAMSQTQFIGTVSAVSMAAGPSMKRCRSGSKMERGLARDAIRVHRGVCARFPKIKTYHGKRASKGHHGSGRAVDVMIPSNRVGWQVAGWVRNNRKRLGVSEVIFARRIWTVQRSKQGWRRMSDRGNKTANHFDHVHVSVYGNRGSS